MKSLLFACCLVLLTAIQTANADVPKPRQAEQARHVLHTSLEIATDPKGYEAKLQISKSGLKSLQEAVAGVPGNTTVAATIGQSPTRTIIAGLLMFLSVSIAGVLFARSTRLSSFGLTQKALVALIFVVAVVGAAAIITRGNAGPPGSYRWRNLPEALADGKPTLGGLDIEIVPDDAMSSTSMRLVLPLKKQKNPGEE